MKKRWFVYALIGIAFGIFDFYYQIFIYNFSYQQVFPGFGISFIRAILVLAIWLVPIIPIILHEVKISASTWLSALASALTWSAAIIGYYLTNAFQLAIIGVSARPEMHISNRNDPYFWTNWRFVFLETLVADNLEWIVVAVIGGSVIGLLLSAFVLKFKDRIFQ